MTITTSGSLPAGPKRRFLTDMFHINWPIGAPVRVLQNSATRGLRGEFGSKFVIGEEEGRPIYLSAPTRRCAQCRRLRAMALYAGQELIGSTQSSPRGTG